MLDYRIAVLVDNLNNTQATEILLKEILSKFRNNITIFAISKEEIVPNALPVFSIAEYFNWDGATIITSFKTLEKASNYPAVGPKVIVGKMKYQDYLNVPEFNLDLIYGVLDDYYKKK